MPAHVTLVRLEVVLQFRFAAPSKSNDPVASEMILFEDVSVVVVRLRHRDSLSGGEVTLE